MKEQSGKENKQTEQNSSKKRDFPSKKRRLEKLQTQSFSILPQKKTTAPRLSFSFGFTALNKRRRKTLNHTIDSRSLSRKRKRTYTLNQIDI